MQQGDLSAVSTFISITFYENACQRGMVVFPSFYNTENSWPPYPFLNHIFTDRGTVCKTLWCLWKCLHILLIFPPLANFYLPLANFQLIWLTLQKGGEFEVHRKNIWTVWVSSHCMPLFVKGMIFIKIEKRGFLSVAVAMEEGPNATILLMDLTTFILLLETFSSSALMVYNLDCLLIFYVEMKYFVLIFWMSTYLHYGVEIGVVEWNGN